MEQSLNEILLRRRNKILLPKGRGVTSLQLLATMLKNVESLGYTFSSELLDGLQQLGDAKLMLVHEGLLPILKKLVGADVQYRPMYPNFPEEVMQADEATLYLNALVHYASKGTLYPRIEKQSRTQLEERPSLRVINEGSREDIAQIFNNLCTSRTSLSQTDKDDMEYLMTRGFKVEMPDEIPVKENAAFICKLYLDAHQDATAEDLSRFCKTATDVLRLVTAMSDGDISLATNTRYRKLRRKERRLIMSLLNQCDNLEEDMLRYKTRWIRIGEIIHPGEYPEYCIANLAFSKLRCGILIETFNSRLDAALSAKNYNAALRLLQTRPGEFARRLDYLLRNDTSAVKVLLAFSDVAAKVSTPVLLQVREHFLHRAEEQKYRVFFPKGNMARCYCVQNDLPVIRPATCKMAAELCEEALIEQYKKRCPLGKVFVSEELKKYTVPFGQRSASKALKTITRGSRVKLPLDTNVLRAFIWWTNTQTGRVDVDLSASIFSENWTHMGHVSYTSLRKSKWNICHSGDITNGGPADGAGASEFIDIDLDSVVSNGARYIVFQVYSYTNQSFAELPHAMFGWMNRSNVSSGEIYEPSTVAQRLDLTSESTACVPVIFDCVTKEAIWCDACLTLGGSHDCYSGNNLESNLIGVAATCYSIVHLSKPNLYDLFTLNARARGALTESKEDADVIFDVDSGITPFDIDTIVSQYL